MPYVLKTRVAGLPCYVTGLLEFNSPDRSKAMVFQTLGEAERFNSHRRREVEWALDHKPVWVSASDLDFERRRELPADAAREIAALSATERRLSAEVTRLRERNEELTVELVATHRQILNQREYIEAAERSADAAIRQRDEMKAELAEAVGRFKALSEAWSDAP